MTDPVTRRPTRVAIYARSAAVTQGTDCVSVRAQLCAARRYCAEQGWEVSDEFVDTAASGISLDRAGYSQLVEKLSNHPPAYEALVVESAGRLWRNGAALADLQNTLASAGIELIVLDELSQRLSKRLGQGARAGQKQEEF